MNPIVIPRNGAELVAEEFEVKKGDNKGNKYMSIKLVADKKDDIIRWFSFPQMLEIVQGRLNILAKGWSTEALAEATDENGNVDHDKFVAVFTDFAKALSSRGETIPNLKSQIESLNEEMVELDLDDVNGMKRAREIIAAIKEKQSSIANKKRKTAEDEEQTLVAAAPVAKAA